MTATPAAADTHAEAIADQFTRQAALFASAPALHDKAALALLVDAARVRPSDVSLDVACGPGSVVRAFAGRVARAVGLDATPAMLEEARQAAAKASLRNVEWHQGDVYALPFGDQSFDIVSCRFAFHHLEQPARAFAEMVRVTRPGGRIVLCDAVASDDPAKAAAFNAMERFRDPSTVEFRTLSFLRGLFPLAGLAAPEERFYNLAVERDQVIARSFPVNDDRAGLKAMLNAAVDGDTMGANARHERGSMWFDYRAAVLVAVKG
jgi:ubiquinone/menaquinone biosynthesis C-methylase UbiE